MHGLTLIIRFTGILAMLSCQLALADDKRPTTDGTLEGTWRADLSSTQTIILSIKDARIEMTAISAEKQLPMWIGKLTISKELPNQHMDWVELRVGNVKLPDNKCLFKLDGDVLLVIGGGPNQRPTQFFSGFGTDPKTLIFFRVLSEKEKAKLNAQSELPKTGS